MCSYDSVLLRHGDESWTWWLDLHHVVTDGWASSLVYDAVRAAYSGEATDAEAGDESSSFYDYVATAVAARTPMPSPLLRVPGGRPPTTRRSPRTVREARAPPR